LAQFSENKIAAGQTPGEAKTPSIAVAFATLNKELSSRAIHSRYGRPIIANFSKIAKYTTLLEINSKVM